MPGFGHELGLHLPPPAGLALTLTRGATWLQVSGLPPGVVPDAGTLQAHFLHSNVSATGRVHFSNASFEILNRIQTAVRYTQLSNLHHHPTDCPQREKRGWMGDSQITSGESPGPKIRFARQGAWVF